MVETVSFTLNGKPASVTVDSDRLLLWVLRTDLALTGTKYGCGESFCGACTVIVNGEAVRSCQTAVKDVRGKKVVTIEGLGSPDHPHALQEAFVAADAVQCGFCTPGMIMSAYAFLQKHKKPTAAQIVEGMDDGLCRCGAHNRIIRAVQAAAKEMHGGL